MQSSKETLKKILPFGLITLIAIICFYRLGSYGLADWDEAIYAEVSKNVLFGHKLTLFWGNGDWFHKPPLYFWITALLYKIFGISELTSRLISAISGVGLTILIFNFTKKFFGIKPGIFSLILILLNSFLLYSFRFGTLDILAMLLTTLSLYYFWCSREKPSYIVISFAMAGLAGMVKGPVFLAVIAIEFVFALFSGELLNFLKSRYFWLGMILMLLIVLPWHIYMLKIHNPDFYNIYYLYQIVKRANEAIEGHSNSHFYYPRLILRNLPLLVIIVSAFIIRKTELIKKRKELLFLVIWALLQYLTIDKVATKLDWYILPFFIPLTILLAYVTSQLYQMNSLSKTLLTLALIVNGVFIIFKPYGAWHNYSKQENIKQCLIGFNELSSQESRFLEQGFKTPTLYYYAKAYNHKEINSETKLESGNIIAVHNEGEGLNYTFDTLYSNNDCEIIKVK